jgi:hypothetical protein
VKYGDVLFYDLLIDGRPVTVAQWMTQPEACRHLRCCVDPVCDWVSLRGALALFDAHGL